MPRPINVLVATDGSQHSRAAVDVLLTLPLPQTRKAAILNVRPVLPPFVVGHEDLNIQSAEQSKQIAAGEAERLGKAGWETSLMLREGHAAEEIVKAAEDLDFQLVVVGSHGTTGLPHLLLGSVAEKVVNHSRCSVLVGRSEEKPEASRDVPPNAASPVKILLAFDGSEPANAAVRLLSEWPLGDLAEATILAVQTVATTLYRMDIAERTSESWASRKQKLQADLDAAAKQLRQATRNVRAELREGGPDPSHEILEAAVKMSANIIVIGHKGTSGIERFLLGSVSNRVVHHAKRTVLVARPWD